MDKKWLRGGTKLNVFLFVCFLALAAWAAASISKPYLKKNRLGNIMAERMRYLGEYPSEREMINDVIAEAEKLGLPPLTWENFEFNGAMGEDSTMVCRYEDSIVFLKLPNDKVYQKKIQMTITKNIFIPARH